MKSFTPILLLVISVGLFFLHIGPRYADVQMLRSQETQYQDALSKATELGAKRDELLTKYNAFPQDDLARLARLVPETLNSVKLIADIDAVGGQHGMTVKTVQVESQAADASQAVAGGAAANNPYQTNSISFRVSATYPNLVLFLKDLEKSLQLIDVTSVIFQTPSDTAQNSGINEYQISIRTYSLK